ncbi:MAG: hypothetical protein ABIR26_20060 [Ramlibacter sp.]
MKFTLAALGCTLALTGVTVFAQQQQPQRDAAASGPTFTEKVKEAAHDLGEKTKETARKIKEKTQQAAHEAKTSDDGRNKSKSTDGSGNTTAATQLQRKADADLKTAKAKCGLFQDSARKSVCLKQAAAAHANAEVKVEQAKASGHNSTSTMGAGKPAR